jgi:HAD superfamily hydrolase (TIGR01509 family)
VTDAVVFDLDGVLLDSEPLWDAARREVTSENGGRWVDDATTAMQGMSSPEWARYLHDVLGVQLAPERIIDLVVGRLLDRYQNGLPLLPGAVEAVRRIGSRWPLGLASSANRVVLDTVLRLAGVQDAFSVTVSSEEVRRGKPAPDVYLEAARQLGFSPVHCVAIEDSANGIRAAVAAGLRVVAVPNREFPPPSGVLARAALVIDRLDDLTVERIDRLSDGSEDRREQRLDEEEAESFPASDPHSGWAGRATDAIRPSALAPTLPVWSTRAAGRPARPAPPG